MNHDKTMRAALQAAELRHEFLDWLRADADKLIAAAQLLGGDRWEDRATSLTDAITFGAELEDLEADLIGLHRLLTLELADDLDAPEARYFTMVHPDDPRADDARICAEALERGLDAMRAHAATPIKEVA